MFCSPHGKGQTGNMSEICMGASQVGDSVCVCVRARKHENVFVHGKGHTDNMSR